jgi:transcription antitermination factor NusA-like protein
MKELLELEESGLRELKDAHYVKSVLYKDMLVLVVKIPRNSDALLKKLSKELSESLKVKVKVIEYTNDIRKVVAQLLSPARVLGVNMVWLPDGTQIYSVRILRSDERLFPMDKNSLGELLHLITGEYFTIKLE